MSSSWNIEAGTSALPRLHQAPRCLSHRVLSELIHPRIMSYHPKSIIKRGRLSCKRSLSSSEILWFIPQNPWTDSNCIDIHTMVGAIKHNILETEVEDGCEMLPWVQSQLIMYCAWSENKSKSISRSQCEDSRTCHNQYAKKNDGCDRTRLWIEFNGEPVGDGCTQGAKIRKEVSQKHRNIVRTEEYIRKWKLESGCKACGQTCHAPSFVLCYSWFNFMQNKAVVCKSFPRSQALDDLDLAKESKLFWRNDNNATTDNECRRQRNGSCKSSLPPKTWEFLHYQWWLLSLSLLPLAQWP